jgi:hypothetical protein
VHDLEGHLSAYLCGIHAMTACTRMEKPWLNRDIFPTRELYTRRQAHESCHSKRHLAQEIG